MSDENQNPEGQPDVVPGTETPPQDNVTETPPADQPQETPPDSDGPPAETTPIDGPPIEETPPTETTDELPVEEEEEQPEALKHPQFDPEGKVMLSDIYGDGIDKKELEDIISASAISEYQKGKIAEQIAKGRIEPSYYTPVKNIINAAKSGSIYRPGQDGL